jgi:hypothetical protein
MSPTHTTLFEVVLAFLAVVPPFLLGRWTRPACCETCTRRAAADRARRNGEAVARHRPRPRPLEGDSYAQAVREWRGLPAPRRTLAAPSAPVVPINRARS